MRFRMLGPLLVHDGLNWVPVRAAQQRVVLAVLLIEAGRVVQTERLVDEVWGDRPPRTAVQTVQAYVMRLRRFLGDGSASLLVTRGRGYELVICDGDLDAWEFERLVGVGRRALVDGQPGRAVAQLSEALALWRGPVLADVPESPSWAARVSQLEQTRLAAVEDQVGALLDLGRHPEAVDDLYRLVREYPLEEQLWSYLVLALHRCGRRAESLTAYQQARQVLVAELGLEPGAQLRELQRAILAEDSPKAAVAGTTPPGRVVPAQLPADVAGFTGRDDQLKQLDALLAGGAAPAATAVVISAIAGTAGVGKTALAVHWAHRIVDRFPDGQLYVNLRGFDPGGSPMASAEAVRRFLDALDVPPQRIPVELDAQAALYRTLLAGKKMLVVQDNARDAGQVRPLLPGAAECLVLVTSRNHLSGLVAADGAHPLTLDLLTPTDAADLLTRRLGLDRVAAEPDAVEQIVTACAGLPLALVIVAARAAAQPQLSLAALAGELHDRQNWLDALVTGAPGTDVRAVFSWSYHALTPDAARLFRLLGLHPGPDISAAAAASLTGLPPAQVRPLLAELTWANLLVEHTPSRYTLHDLLRAYATHLAHTTDPDDQRYAATHRVLDHYLHTAHTASRLLYPARDPILLTSPQPDVTPEHPADHAQALAWFTAEYSVLLAAVDHAATTGFDNHTEQLAWALVGFLDRRGHWHDWAATSRIAVTAARRLGDPTTQARAHRLLAHAYIRLDRFDDAHTQLRRALDLHSKAGDQRQQAHTHHNLAYLWEQRGRPADALDHARHALDLYQATGHRHGQATALNNIGWIHALLSDHQQALTHCQQALILNQELGDRVGQAHTWDSIGYAHHRLSHLTQAIDCYQRAIDLYRDIGDPYYKATTLTHLGDVHHAAGNPHAARDVWQQALTILTDLDHPDADQIRTKLASLDVGPGGHGNRPTRT